MSSSGHDPEPGTPAKPKPGGGQSALTSAMARVAAGDFHTKLSVDDGDVRLIDAFNTMVDSIRDEAGMLETVKDIAGELNLDALLQRIISAVTSLLNAERSSLFLYDRKSNDLFSRIAEGV
jgi:adenylate cyclase